MSMSIGGHTLTISQQRTLGEAQLYLLRNAGDSHASATTSPKGDGRAIDPIEIWGRNNQSTAHRRNLRKLEELGVLRGCEMKYDGLLAWRPL
jgi:hypothetical protein